MDAQGAQQAVAAAPAAQGEPAAAGGATAAAAAPAATAGQPGPAAQQQQQPAQQAAPLATAGPAAAADAGDGEGAPPAAKRARIAALQPPPDFCYSPEGECDLVVKTADGKRIGVHRLIVLRVAGFFRELLEACAESEVGWGGVE